MTTQLGPSLISEQLSTTLLYTNNRKVFKILKLLFSFININTEIVLQCNQFIVLYFKFWLFFVVCFLPIYSPASVV
jgi:hypothetical protein